RGGAGRRERPRPLVGDAGHERRARGMRGRGENRHDQAKWQEKCAPTHDPRARVAQVPSEGRFAFALADDARPRSEGAHFLHDLPAPYRGRAGRGDLGRSPGPRGEARGAARRALVGGRRRRDRGGGAHMGARQCPERHLLAHRQLGRPLRRLTFRLTCALPSAEDQRTDRRNGSPVVSGLEDSMRRMTFAAAVLCALVATGYAVAHGIDGAKSAKAVAGGFNATASSVSTRTCTTGDGKAIVVTDGKYT